MLIKVLSIGKTNVSFVKDGLLEYLNRLKHYAKVDWEELQDIKKIDRNNRTLLMSKEGELFLKHIQPNDTVVLLDDKGKQFDSVQLAKWLEKKQLGSGGNLVFLIGGAYGFSDQIKQRSNEKLSLSALTFNHQMVRLIFLEQLYRAHTILRGEPYHHQ